ncbi:myotubularin-related protein 3-like isoform X3 [Daphnia pulicaria]|uniref:myotubularin-related protein 3-like isoform X3 n=1 Tax=Daphnia pulicaria TaxID=35523 RepID=UPI001EEC1CE6|nr:myotubularin-related protein 3-like isoform X3 [Daphnia pulicaria]
MAQVNGDESVSKYAAVPESGVARLHSAAVPIKQPSVNGKALCSNGSSSSISSFRLSVGSGSSGDTDIQYIKPSELFPKKLAWVEGGSANTIPPPFPLLPGEDIIYEGRAVEGTLYISNYRLYLSKKVPTEAFAIPPALSPQSSVRDVNVPLGLIESIECKDIFYINLYCKDARSFRLIFVNGECCQDWLKRLSQSLNLPRKPEEVFSLAFYAWTRDDDENHLTKPPVNQTMPWWRNLSNYDQPLTGEKLFRFEVERQGYDDSVTWRISSANADFKLSPSYPTHLLVPTSISDDMLEAVAAFRSARRLPAVVWRHKRNGAVLGRCSQPEVGWLGWRSQEDETLLLSILNSCFYDSANNPLRSRHPTPNKDMNSTNEEWNGEGSLSISNGSSSNVECGSLKDLSEDSSCFTQGHKKKMLIVDARSYATAVANRARGGGCEFPQYYPQCDIEFMNLANIHAVRKSFLLLRALCQSAIGNLATTDQSNWFTQLDSTRWLHHMANLLRASWYTAVNLEEHGRPVLVHCSDGWDRTPQIVSLAQIMIDPFYRTVKGFQILVQREWIEFGHKFADRCGLLGGCEDTNERCPVFLQFLDCVHQLMSQFPTAFQFNHAYLVKMVQHIYSNLFGTFLLNTVQERTSHRISERSHSLWSFLLQKSNEYSNYLYELTEEPIWPSYQVRDLYFWSAVYTAELGSMPNDCQTGDCRENSTTVNLNTSSSPCSSGYATPQQTALTDSMVDTLAWKNLNIKGGVRNPMEDSTDTLVDDGHKVWQRKSSINMPTTVLDQSDGDMEAGESFPLLEPEPVKEPSYKEHQDPLPSMTHFRSKQLKSPLEEPLCLPQNIASEEDGEDSEVDGRNSYLNNCPTCKRNWDLLNRNQTHSKADPAPMTFNDGEEKAIATTMTRLGDSTATCLGYDLDGLLPSIDRQQVRLGQILAAKDAELDALRRDLHQTRVALCRQVCHDCKSSRKTNSSSKSNSEGLIEESCRDGSPGRNESSDCSLGGLNSSPSSWENVDEKEIGDKAPVGPPILWVPDHLAPSCMRCSTPFWMARRRHHCRNCGKVFCSECADRDLPLPHQNLFQPVRVCNVCYDSLSGENEDGEMCLGALQEHPDFSATRSHLGRAFSLTSLATGSCACHCCQLKRPTKFKAVTAGST